MIFSSMSITDSRVTLIDPGSNGMTTEPSLTVSSYSGPSPFHTVENTVSNIVSKYTTSITTSNGHPTSSSISNEYLTSAPTPSTAMPGRIIL